MCCVLVIAFGLLSFQSSSVALPLHCVSYADHVLIEFDTDAPIGAFAFSKNGEVLIAAGSVQLNKECILLRRDLKQNVFLPHLRTEFGNYIKFLDRSPDGESLLAVDGNGNVAVFKEFEQVAKFRLFEQKVNRLLDVKFLNNAEIVTFSRESVTERRNFKTGLTKLYHLWARTPKAGGIAIEADALVWANDRAVFLWKPMLHADPDPIAIPAADNRYSKIVCSNDAGTILCGGDYSQLALYDMEKGKLVKAWKAHGHEAIAGLVSLKQRNEFLSVSMRGEVKVWSAAGEMVAATTLGDDLTVYGIRANHESTLVAIGTENKVFVLDVKALRSR
jgi:WD40 repeat protein